MRNLKKILALVLALVMSLSLMATAGAADAAASNSETITAGYQTAVDVLKGVKVFNGYSDGTFKPQQTITRAEVAAILYRIATGDVTDAKKDIYTDMANVNFTDLAGANWAKGYINYCSNAELIVGMGDGTFRPSQPISGYATLAMILRALGYDQNNEFKGSGWELRTASKARELGILNNVTGDLGSYATREMVAEILFRAILNETVTYSPMNQNGYQKTGTTLAKQNLSLEEVEGVVVANEYADLDDDEVLAVDKTRLDTHAALLDYHTTLDDIGESRLAYIHKGSTVLSIADTGKNNTAESTAALSNLNSLKSEAGISGDAKGENYINFSKYDKCNSDYKIKYVLKYNVEADAVTAQAKINYASEAAVGSIGYATLSVADGVYTVTRTIVAKNTITGVDLEMMKVIFGKADLIDSSIIDGEVYVGTQSNTDISDDYVNHYSYERFEEEFINFFEEASVSANERGNWVKVIDNDGDGVTDYIFKVVYTVAQIANVKDDTYTLDTKNHTLVDHHPDAAEDAEKQFNNVTGQKVVATNGETFERGDVVYYAVIDGRAQTVKCDTVTAQIEKVDHNNLVATTTDGTEYTESQVCEHIEDEAYESRVRRLSGKVSYELYFDRGGYLAAFVKTDKVGDFQLITDGWYDRLKANKEYAVRVYNDETGKQDIVDLTSNGSLFVIDDTNSVIQNNNWGALKAFGGSLNGYATDAAGNRIAALNGDGSAVYTTVAAITADGTILPVENSAVTGRYDHAMIDLRVEGKAGIPLRTAVSGNIYDTRDGAKTAYNRASTANVSVRALDNTIYYVVYPDDAMESNVHVLSYTGYNSGIESAFKSWKDKGYVEDVYAVGTAHKADNDLGAPSYYTADVVVIELHTYDQAGRLVLVVDDTARFSDVTLRDVQIIDNDGELKTVTVNWNGYTQSYSDNRDNHKKIEPGLYYLYDTSDDNIYRLGNSEGVHTRLTAEEIRKAGCIATGQVEKHEWLANNKYVVTQNWANKNGVYENVKEGQYDLSDDTPLYTLKYNDTTWTEYAPTITKVDHETALAGRVNETRDVALYRDGFRDAVRTVNHNDTYYNYNDVMVFYNSKGAAVYAVSFENVYSDSARKYDYAQTLWRNVMPADVDNTFDVTFYGVGNNTDNDNLKVEGDHHIQIEYDVALAWANNADNANKDALTVKGASEWFVTVDNDTTDILKKVPHDPIKTGVTYQLNVLKTGATAWEIWTLEVVVAEDVAILQEDMNNDGVFEDVAGTVIDYVGSPDLLINVIEKQFQAKGKGTMDDWTVKSGNGAIVPVDDKSAWQDGYTATFTVTAQDGVTKTNYTIRFIAATGSTVPTPQDRVDAANALAAYDATIERFAELDADEVAALKATAQAAIDAAMTKTALEKAVKDYQDAIDALVAALAPLPVEITEATFAGTVYGLMDTPTVGGDPVAVAITPVVKTDIVDNKVTLTQDDIKTERYTFTVTDIEVVSGGTVEKTATGWDITLTDKNVVLNVKYDVATLAPITEEEKPGEDQKPGGNWDDENSGVTVTPGTDPDVDIDVVPVPPASRPAGRTLSNETVAEIGVRITIPAGRVVDRIFFGMVATQRVFDDTTNAAGDRLISYAVTPLEAGVKVVVSVTLKPENAPSNEEIKAAQDKLDEVLTADQLAALTEEQKAELDDVIAAQKAEIAKVTDKTKLDEAVTAASKVITDKYAELTKAEGDVTINVDGNAAMSFASKTVTGTAEEITFAISMTVPGYKPVISKVTDAKNATISSNKWDASKNIKMVPSEDGMTWNATVAKAEDGMTLTFKADPLDAITVGPKSGETDKISNITPRTRYVVNGTDAKYVFNFTVKAGETPQVDTNTGSCTCTFARVGTGNDWTMTVTPGTAGNKTITLTSGEKSEVKVAVDSNAALTDTKTKTLEIVNGKVEFEVETTSTGRIPQMNAGVKADGTTADNTKWTYKYNESTGKWTVSSSTTGGETATKGSTYTLKTDSQTAATIIKGDGIDTIDRTVVYPCEATGTIGSETFDIKVTLKDGYQKGADVTSKITWGAKADGAYPVTLTIAALNDAAKKITIAAGSVTVPTLSAAAGADGAGIYANALAGQFVWDDAKGTGTTTYTLTGVDSDVKIENAKILRNDTSTAVAGAKATRNDDGSWEIVVPYTVGDTHYVVKSTKLYNISLQKPASTDITVLKDVSDYAYTATDVPYVRFQITKGMSAVATQVKPEPTTGSPAVAATIKQNMDLSTSTYDVYDLTVASLTKNLTYKLEAEESTEYTVKLTEGDGRAWSLSTHELTTKTGSAEFTVEMKSNLFPFVADGEHYDVEYVPEPVENGDKNVWTIRLSGIDQDVTVTVKSVEGVSLVTPDNAVESDFTPKFNKVQNYLASLPAGVAEEDVVTEIIDKTGKHIVTVKGDMNGKIDETWFTAAAKDASNNPRNVTLTGLFTASTWANLITTLQTPAPAWNLRNVTASDEIAIMALLLPGTAEDPAATGILKISIAIDNGSVKYEQVSNGVAYEITYEVDLAAGNPAAAYNP